jgi:hypothetical protein
MDHKNPYVMRANNRAGGTFFFTPPKGITREKKAKATAQSEADTALLKLPKSKISPQIRNSTSFQKSLFQVLQQLAQ